MELYVGTRYWKEWSAVHASPTLPLGKDPRFQRINVVRCLLCIQELFYGPNIKERDTSIWSRLPHSSAVYRRSHVINRTSLEVAYFV
jgi:hypothetical protein